MKKFCFRFIIQQQARREAWAGGRSPRPSLIKPSAKLSSQAFRQGPCVSALLAVSQHSRPYTYSGLQGKRSHTPFSLQEKASRRPSGGHVCKLSANFLLTCLRQKEKPGWLRRRDCCRGAPSCLAPGPKKEKACALCPPIALTICAAFIYFSIAFPKNYKNCKRRFAALRARGRQPSHHAKDQGRGGFSIGCSRVPA